MLLTIPIAFRIFLRPHALHKLFIIILGYNPYRDDSLKAFSDH